MRTVMVIHPEFDRSWPFAAVRFEQLFRQSGELEVIRLETGSASRVGDVVRHPETVTRLISLQVEITRECVLRFSALEEAVIESTYQSAEPPSEIIETLREQNIQWYTQPTEGFWGQSVAEFALALTLCGLRRIPQTHHEMISSLDPWNYDSPDGVGRPGSRGFQFGDDSRFANGTIEGKRVRIVGAGNVASRYASFVRMLGADVAAWDPYAAEPCFHRAGARKEWHLDSLVLDADIFAPMLPLTPQTREIVTADHIRSLPKGTLVVLATRAEICDMKELRRRVLADEISLAADVFDIEPLPLNDSLLGRHNVVHTPHNAGRTKEANYRYAENLYLQFRKL
ncbi:NAD(P)-dependent oxidoreductase [Cohnella lupini]|uniref:D-isomer specific 2-hydroxyacid dehydrogenase-like protein n=1 Tax=Cohnella lupini TaxID=1294267 RepID=A0A3D9IMU4_9BACL|nr:NAD(P)-dependent oxidoreductase [Cohnella lupini]RED63028.1 D-isomer specific 2-hydroxyacid dehydrogenase-like protein [Cohnella lupini]